MDIKKSNFILVSTTFPLKKIILKVIFDAELVFLKDQVFLLNSKYVNLNVFFDEPLQIYDGLISH